MSRAGDPKPLEQLAGRKLSYWLALVLRAHREAAGTSRLELARTLDHDPSVLVRLERGKSLPPEIDRYVAAYAEAAGIEDPRSLYQEAIDLWVDRGAPPLVNPGELSEERPSQRVERAIREQLLRDRQARRERTEAPNSSPKRQAVR